MKQVSTVCARDCYDTCSLKITLGKAEQILSITGDPTNPITQGFTCPRGAKDHIRLHHNRVENPSLRNGDHFEKDSWEQALDVVSQKLRETIERYGSESVLYLDYAGNMGLLTTIFPKRLWNSIGATQTNWALCSKSGHDALSLHYGDSYGIKPIEILNMNLVVFWGFNAAVSSPHMWALAKKARKERGAQIIVIDPRESKTAKSADLWIQPMPGTDVALAYGVMNHLIQNGYMDRKFIKEWTHGFEHLTAEAGKWTPDRVQQITGVSWRYIEQLGDAYGSLTPSTTMIGIGLQKCDQGADQVRAVSFIPALLGLHRGFFYSNESSFSVDEPLISGQALAAKTSKIVSQVALADLVKSGKFKFIYISCMNPAITLPNQHAFREGISRPDIFTVVHETHWTKTTQYADVVLPASTYLEKEDLTIPYGHNYVQYSSRVVRPITNSRSEVWVMRKIAERLGLKEEWLYEEPWVSVESALESALEEGTFQPLKSGKMLTLKTKPKNNYSTPSGKIELYSSIAAENGLNPLPIQTPLCIEKGKFIMLNSATAKYTSTQFQEVYGAIPARVVINSKDAKRQGIKEGHIVTIANERGQVQAKATVSDTLPERVVWCPRQLEGLTGKPLNGLIGSTPQEIGGGPRFNSTIVTVTGH
ncbi:MAG: molybdopterin-dependent oxidoreductase [Thermodesulfobacteriota bacterium]|nr:molybdopterin-dependent oxidoreductase [Thermodesulfobacteriota bacterium]